VNVLDVELIKIYAYRKQITLLFGCCSAFLILYASSTFTNFDENFYTIRYEVKNLNKERYYLYSVARVAYLFNSIFITGLVALLVEQENYCSWRHFILHPYSIFYSLVTKFILIISLTLFINFFALLPTGLAGIHAIQEFSSRPLTYFLLPIVHIIFNNLISASLFVTTLLYTGFFIKKNSSVIYLLGMVLIGISYTGLPLCPGYSLLKIHEEISYYPATVSIGFFISIFIHFTFFIFKTRAFPENL